jgi:hypothetical protein
MLSAPHYYSVKSTVLNYNEVEGILKDTFMTKLSAQYRHLPGRTEINNENSQSGWTVSGQRLEPETSRIRFRSTKYSAANYI